MRGFDELARLACAAASPPREGVSARAAHELQIVDPGLVFVNDMDFDVAAATRRRVIAELADSGATVLAGHFYGRGRIERVGKGFRWAVE